MRTGRAHTWIRQNILGLVAIFIALSGSAVAAQVAINGGANKAVKKKAKPGPPGPAGAQGPAGALGPQGLQGPSGAGGAPSGPAGGDLLGSTYPNPVIAPDAVTGGEVLNDSLDGFDITNLDGPSIAANTLTGVQIDEAALNSTCPAGTVFHAAACIETARRDNLDYVGALGLCLSLGRRLPTVAELQTFRNHPGSTMTAQAEWTTATYDDDNGTTTTTKVLVVPSTGAGFVSPAFPTVRFYRCVAPWP